MDLYALYIYSTEVALRYLKGHCRPSCSFVFHIILSSIKAVQMLCVGYTYPLPDKLARPDKLLRRSYYAGVER